MEFLILLLLIILNGIFAMTEIAIISARKSKLKQMAEKGDTNAKKALELASTPNRFLSTVQIGITFVGIFAGAFGGKTLARSLASFLSQVPFIGIHSDLIALLLVVFFITYLSLVIGELVPKRIALSNPERIGSYMAKYMHVLSFLSAPLILFLSASTDWILKLFKVKLIPEAHITEDEVKMLIREGARVGVFNLAEKDIVERTFLLSDKKASMLMTPREDIKWLDIAQGSKKVRETISEDSYSYFPVGSEDLDKVIGVVRTKEVLTNYLTEDKLDLRKFIQKPLFIPENMDALKLLELFKKSGVHIAFVVDEYRNIQGLLSITDLLEAIVGDIPTIDEMQKTEIVQRDDGTWLVDGLVLIDEFKEYFRIPIFPGEKSGLFQTVGGFVIHHVGHVPKTGDAFERMGLRFEVIDMDGTRVDKILVKKFLGEQGHKETKTKEKTHTKH